MNRCKRHISPPGDFEDSLATSMRATRLQWNAFVAACGVGLATGFGLAMLFSIACHL